MPKKYITSICRLILVCIVFFLYFLIGQFEFVLAFFFKATLSIGVRSLSVLLLKVGCSASLVLAIGFAVRALLATEATPYLVNMVLPAGVDENPNKTPPVYPDNSGENPNLPHGYWNLRRVIFDYLHAMGTPDGGPVPSHRKAARVFEITAGPRYKSTEGLLEILRVVSENPANNPIEAQARQIFNDLYRRRIRDADLYFTNRYNLRISSSPTSL